MPAPLPPPCWLLSASGSPSPLSQPLLGPGMVSPSGHSLEQASQARGAPCKSRGFVHREERPLRCSVAGCDFAPSLANDIFLY